MQQSERDTKRVIKEAVERGRATPFLTESYNVRDRQQQERESLAVWRLITILCESGLSVEQAEMHLSKEEWPLYVQAKEMDVCKKEARAR